MKKITILWWFGQWNLGDDIILYNQVKILQEYYNNPEITVFSGKYNAMLTDIMPWISTIKFPPISWYRLYKFLDIFYLYKVFQILKSTDVFILWGGWFFSDRQFFSLWWWLRYCQIASFFWAQCLWFCMWVWPITHNYNKLLVSHKLSDLFHFILVRDKTSFDCLRQLDIPKDKISQAIDPAFFTEKLVYNKDNSIWFIIYNHTNISFYISQIKKIQKNYKGNIKIIITDYLDISIAKQIKNSCSDIDVVIPSNAISLTQEISRSDFIFSERLHGSIIAFTQRVPFSNIYYHHKGKELADILDIHNFSIDIHSLDEVNLNNYINKRWNFVFKDIKLASYESLIHEKLSVLM